MKKVLKFVCSIAAGAAAGFGAYCVYKNVLAKKNEEDCDDFDDFDEDVTEESDENREYVSINITEEETVPEEAEESTEEVEETSTEEVKETEEA